MCRRRAFAPTTNTLLASRHQHEIAVQQAAQIDEKLLVKRQIKSKPSPHGFIGFGICKLSDDRPDRVGRHHPANDEGDAEQDEEADDKLQEAMSEPAQ